jgi:tetratricopeptide (TPR) repeat protein
MRYRTHRLRATFLLLAGLSLVLPGLGQYREYLISGKVVDTQKKALEGVEITLRDTATSRSYNLKTKKDGSFKFAGLPHGVYMVVFKKDGFAAKADEWKFETPQDTMQKVEIPDVVLAAQEVIQEAQRMKEAAAGVKESAEMIRQGDYDGALVKLKAILEKDPNDLNAVYLTGMAYLKKRMWAEAMGPFLRVTELSPKFAAAYYQLGVCHQQQKEDEKALLDYQKAMELDPANPDSPYNSGLILFGLNRVEESLALFEKTLNLKPDDPAALEMAGRCYIHQANFQKAIDYLEKAKAGYASDAERVKFLDDLLSKLKEQIKK